MRREPVWLYVSGAIAVLALVTLAVTPIVYQRYVTGIRLGISAVREPASSAEAALRMGLAREVAAIRGYLLTRDTALLAEYRRAREGELAAHDRLRALSPHLDSTSAARVQRVIASSSEWSALNEQLLRGTIAPAEVLRQFSVQQQRYLAALNESAALESALLTSTREVRERTRAAERLWTVSSVVLSILAAASGVLVILLLRTSITERSLARTDGLTDLLNRRGFHEAAAVELSRARRYQFVVTMLVLDLDGFKAVNDERGHDAGDLLLRDVADGLRHALRVTDIAARLGGDEFAVLLSDNRHDPPELLVMEVRDRVASTLRERLWPVTLSVGAVTSREPGDAEALLVEADRQMYAAKRGGKNAISHADVRVLPAPASHERHPVAR